MATLQRRRRFKIKPKPTIADTSASTLEWLGGPSYFAAGRVTLEAVTGLFERAAALHRAAPWKIANENQVLSLDIPSLRIRAACLSIVGDSPHVGFVLFESFAAYEQFLESLKANARDPSLQLDLGGETLALSFTPRERMPPAMLAEIKQHKWRCATRRTVPEVKRHARDTVSIPLEERDYQIATTCCAVLTEFVAPNRVLFEEQAVRDFDPIAASYDDLPHPARLIAPHPEALG